MTSALFPTSMQPQTPDPLISDVSFPGTVNPPTREQIAELAHSIWEHEGRPEGQDLEHWRQAESILQVKRLAGH